MDSAAWLDDLLAELAEHHPDPGSLRWPLWRDRAGVHHLDPGCRPAPLQTLTWPVTAVADPPLPCPDCLVAELDGGQLHRLIGRLALRALILLGARPAEAQAIVEAVCAGPTALISRPLLCRLAHDRLPCRPLIGGTLIAHTPERGAALARIPQVAQRLVHLSPALGLWVIEAEPGCPSGGVVLGDVGTVDIEALEMLGMLCDDARSGGAVFDVNALWPTARALLA